MKKPICKLTGEDGNVFNIISIVNRTLKLNNMKGEAKLFMMNAFAQESYEDVLKLASEFVNIQ